MTTIMKFFEKMSKEGKPSGVNKYEGKEEMNGLRNSFGPSSSSASSTSGCFHSKALVLPGKTKK